LRTSRTPRTSSCIRPIRASTPASRHSGGYVGHGATHTLSSAFVGRGSPRSGGKASQLLLMVARLDRREQHLCPRRARERSTPGQPERECRTSCRGSPEAGDEVVEMAVGDLRHERQGQVPLLGCRPPEAGFGLLPGSEKLRQILDHVVGRDESHEHPHADDRNRATPRPRANSGSARLGIRDGEVGQGFL